MSFVIYEENLIFFFISACCCRPSALLLLASMLLSLPMFLLAPLLLQVFLLLLALLLLALLHFRNVAARCPCCCFFSRANVGKVFRTFRVPRRRPFVFSNTGKVFRSPECFLLHSQMLENSGPWNQARSPSRGQTFPAFGNAKGLLPGTRRVFWHGECEKDLWVAGINVLVSAAGLSIFRNGIFWWEA